MPHDIPGAEYSHAGECCSYDYLCASMDCMDPANLHITE